MAESLRVLKLLLYKSFLIRKRQWKMALFGEVLIPVGLIVAVWAIRNAAPADPPVKHEKDSYYRNISREELVNITASGNWTVFFAPNNSFINLLMADVNSCFRPAPNISNLIGFATERELVYEYERIEIQNSTNGVAIIFDDKNFTESSQNLGYKIRSKNLRFNLPLYNVLPRIDLYGYFTLRNAFAQLQICTDQAFMKTKMKNILDNSNTFVQRLPYPPYVEFSRADEGFRQFFGSLAVVVFMIPLFIEVSKASSEKFLGVNVLMSMNGVSNALNLLSWLISGWLFLSVLCVIPIISVLSISTGDTVSFWYYANPIIVLIIFTVHIAHLLIYGVHVSAYFSRSLVVTFGLLIIHVGSVDLVLYFFDEDTYPLVPYLGILFPNLLLLRAIDELNYYETIQEGSHWNNIFVVGNSAYKFAGSIGMMITFSMIGVFVHFLLAVYIYAINPGKYGVRKHPLFFLQFKSKERNSTNYVEDLDRNGTSRELFESASEKAYTPGIQIRNLKKSYKISMFNKTKVHALRGVSIDFYKGQITSLLGHNGAGKTTMMSILTGMTSPSDGLVQINSKNIKEHASEILNEMGLCTQENMLFPNLSVGEQLLFFAMLKGKDKTRDEIEHNVISFLEKLKLYEKRDSLPQQLSGGQKRRVCLGMALAGDPSTLILDEPTSGLDPENRRVIWDILLKLRGRKTILISTHDMEEADILGDRIAILHAGQFRSYGTSMFLKKTIGQGNVEVTLSVEAGVDAERLLDELDSRGKIINQDGSKIVMSIPNSLELPDSLDKVERRKTELCVTGLSVSLISLEQVFLEVTKESDDHDKPRQSFGRVENKLTDTKLVMQSIRALISKKFTYTIKNISVLFIMLFLMFIALLCISIILKVTDFTKPREKLVDIKLSMYHEPETFYKSFNESLGIRYKQLTQDSKGIANEACHSSVSEGLLNKAKKDVSHYDNHVIAAAEFNQTDTGFVFNALYSEKTSFSLPISINLLSNAILKHFAGDDYSISLSSQKLPSLTSIVYTDFSPVQAFTIAIMFVFLFFPTIALFVLHPLRETLASVKQLQRMTGVSCLTYWGTNFIFDFVVYFFLTIAILIGFLCIDVYLELKMYELKEIGISLLCFVLFAINALPFVYIFTFKSGTASSVVRLLTYISLGIVSVEIIMYAVKYSLDTYEIVDIIRTIQKRIFMLCPYISFLHSQISFFVTAMTNARCKRLPNDFYDIKCSTPAGFTEICCAFGCRNGKCRRSLKFFNDFKGDINLETSFIYLALTPILYIGILVLLEYQWFQTQILKLRKVDVPETSVKEDEQVKTERLSIAQKISSFNNTDLRGISYSFPTSSTQNYDHSFREEFSQADNNQVFLIYELRKQYGNLLAVKDISFKVNQSECFGLLGVNGAGKSTTFRMMTGGEVPDKGIMYVGDRDMRNNRKYCLSQMGYCPQNDAIIRSLNAYDHLKLFARLRGIPEHRVELEVKTWIQRLNLIACASQPSGTYSGGNKRRLNIAIALIGIPKLVLLDEPTTGVDPGARRSLWNVIQSCQTTGQAVVLTSHSMEECEALCNRLAIMVDGRLVCIGPAQELKQRFGTGYDIQMKIDPERATNQINAIKVDISKLLNCELTDENIGFLMYHVKPVGTSWRKMYDVMNGMKSKYNCIDDFTVSSSTLEQLFLLFAREAQNNSIQ